LNPLNFEILKIMQINIPEISLVTLVGVTSSGKSTFARRHFKSTEILSSDKCRAMTSDDENNQAASSDAFDVLYYIAGKRLKRGLLTVIDATNVQAGSRKHIINLARQYHCLPVAIVFDLPENVYFERNLNRTDRQLNSHVIRSQCKDLKQTIRHLKDEGFRHVYVFKSEEEVNALTGITRDKLYNDKRDECGPFDIIGDVHGCFDELRELLVSLGYDISETSCVTAKENHIPEDAGYFGFRVTAPQSRKVIFLGDLVDRGPDNVSVLRLAMSMVKSGIAYCVQGNHDMKLQKYLKGKKVQLTHGFNVTASQIDSETEDFRKSVNSFLNSLVSHYVLDNGRLVVAHAGLREDMQGRASGAVRSFCLYGETTGETDEFGLPVRNNWAEEYRGQAKVVYGHVSVPKAEWFNRTIDIDTGCAYGGCLTALRYPEEELVSAKARKTYYESVRPIDFDLESLQSLKPDSNSMPDIADISGHRIVQTRLRNNITIREENSIAAIEILSRFAVHPQWLIYLPPTMSPCRTSVLPDYLEHPAEALEYYRKQGVEKVICEQKHMGSRAVLVVCKDNETALRRFGVETENAGVCYTRTGRRFFTDRPTETAFLERVRQALANSGFWEKFDTQWVCLDAELMPWSAKAKMLLKDQYAMTGAAASAALPAAVKALEQAAERGLQDVSGYLDKFRAKETAVERYIAAYRAYCWQVDSLDDYKLAPFHILATENAVHVDKNHEWHLQEIAAVCAADKGLLLPTPYRIAMPNDAESCEAATAWWSEMTCNGGEGMVIKPYDFVSYGADGLLQPAVKCRGQEYLRIIYGPEYNLPENLIRLKKRSIGRKQSLALREFALGIEALERFVGKEPLYRVHESVFGVLALESEEVDARL
jgi:polynucleotide kinase-phosphatase